MTEQGFAQWDGAIPLAVSARHGVAHGDGAYGRFERLV